MLTLDDRLSLCADMVRGDILCDVGTDHGLLPLYLIQQGKCSRAVVTDINEKPLASAVRLAEKEELTDRIKAFCCDGTVGADLTGVTDVVFAGMGGELIARIILNDERLKNLRLIAQPMTKAYRLRKSLLQSGFEITEEHAARDGRHLYTVIVFSYTGNITEDEYIFHTGRLSPAESASREYLKDYLFKLRRAAEGKRSSEPDVSRELTDIADRIEEMLKRG